jgi:hypothetical protein
MGMCIELPTDDILISVNNHIETLRPSVKTVNPPWRDVSSDVDDLIVVFSLLQLIDKPLNLVTRISNVLD